MTQQEHDTTIALKARIFDLGEQLNAQNLLLGQIAEIAGGAESADELLSKLKTHSEAYHDTCGKNACPEVTIEDHPVAAPTPSGAV